MDVFLGTIDFLKRIIHAFVAIIEAFVRIIGAFVTDYMFVWKY